MSDLDNKCKEIIEGIEKNIQSEQDVAYAKNAIYNTIKVFLDEIDSEKELTEKRLEGIAQTLANIDEKQQKMDKRLKSIEKDIYEEDEDGDFEIICPYCNNEFFVQYDELKDEVSCPECNNTIELDWNEDSDEEGCGDCSCCDHDCDNEDVEYDVYDENDDDM